MAKKTNTTINNNNYYRVRAKVGMNKEGKNIMKAFYGSSKKEAEEKRDKYLEGIKRGLGVDYDKVTFEKMFENWFEIVLRPTLAISSYNRYEIQHRLHIKSAEFYSNKLLSVKSIDIQKHLNNIDSSHIAMRVYLLFTSFYKYCKKERLVIHNPMDSITRPVHEKTRKKEFLTKTDIDQLMVDFKDNDNLLIYVFALFTGLRQGEICALTHGDLDLDNRLIDVNKSLRRMKVDDKIQVVVNNPKTKESNRIVPLPVNLVNYMKKHINQEKLKHLKQGLPFSNDNLLFTSNTCTALRADRLTSRWRDYQDKVNISGTNFHALRHTFCTLLAEEGVPIKTASVLMGHTDINTTAKIYTHVDQDQKQKAIDKLNLFIK
ncbi:Phage integrase family protein [Dethiosulfatibacter aminovorans DSM 17477]|uniref:Phage integrase family protein n=1 Tax=Dethiosulfatibacter aminovorans DSM 17477 TaxID=1121476 RepID=A0A1M6EPS4_9FIRM|nr:site-specific integrase [Dethiosulfatibacter aminovorans]SHI87416.1 Phage integrase family protein [Dethiosulfatibacter aminovorans DSM 17477]